jgi:hypothetical protein
MQIRKLMLFVICLAVIGVPFVVKPTKAVACSCAPPPAVSEELARKTAIFSGKVTAVTPPKKKPVMSSADPVKIDFEVTEVWKGNVAKTTAVYTAQSSASCGYQGFTEGKEYIVYAYGSEERLETGLCERTKPLASASEDLKELGTGQPHAVLTGTVKKGPAAEEAVQAGASQAEGRSLAALAVPILGAALAIAALVWVSRRRRSP